MIGLRIDMIKLANNNIFGIIKKGADIRSAPLKNTIQGYNTMLNHDINHYDHYRKLSLLIYWKDGMPYWNCNHSSKARKDQIAGCIHGTGYRVFCSSINNNRVTIKAHRLRWFMAHGKLPKYLDHINRIKDDNRLENLRPCTASQNSRNCPAQKNRLSGYRGVTVVNRKSPYRAQIRIGIHTISLGSFENEIDAAKAYDKALIRYDLQEFGIFNFPKEVIA